MYACPQCQFPQQHPSTHCSWCGAPLPAPSQPLVPSASAPTPPPPTGARHTPTQRRLIMPGIGMLSSHTTTQTTATTSSSQTVIYPQRAPLFAPVYPTATMQNAWSSASPYLPTAAPPSAPALWGIPATNTPSGKLAERWWTWVPFIVPMLGWVMTHDMLYWSTICNTWGRVCYAGALVIGISVAAAPFRLAHWYKHLAPLSTATVLLILGLFTTIIAQPMDLIQAQQTEISGNYAQSIALYQHLQRSDDIARVQILWGNKLADQDDFAAAQPHLNDALKSATGPRLNQARRALSHLLWRWGQSLYASGDIPATRAKWEAATTLAPGTPDGERAADALATPQTVTGHISWHGVPAPGLTIALITGWHTFPDALQNIQANGDRLEGTSNSEGAFAISGAIPGTTYALIWSGSLGDRTALTHDGKPMYTVTILALQGSDMGMIEVTTA